MRTIIAALLLIAPPKISQADCPTADTASRLEVFKVETNDHIRAVFDLLIADSKGEILLEQRLREVEKQSRNSLQEVVIEDLLRRTSEQQARIEMLERQVRSLDAGAQFVPVRE